MFNRLFRGHVYVNMVKVSYSPEQEVVIANLTQFLHVR